MSKRPAVSLSTGSLMKRMAREDEKAAAASSADLSVPSRRTNPYLVRPVAPEQALQIFLTQARTAARKFLPKEATFPVSAPFAEIEARLGVLTTPHSGRQRVTSSGPKHVQRGRVVHAFECSSLQPPCPMHSGVTRSHYVHWTQAGLSDVSPISKALASHDKDSIKRDVVENELVETVYAGYQQNFRVLFPGVHPSSKKDVVGRMEYKERLAQMDLCLPAANYDLRISTAAEKHVNDSIQTDPPRGWTMKRVKRRRSYKRRDKTIAWQLDVTEVTTSYADTTRPSDVSYEIEMELDSSTTLQLVNETDESKLKKMTEQLAQQLWWMLRQINPLSDALDVEEFLQDHPDSHAVRLARAQCGALRRYMDGSRDGTYSSPIASPQDTPQASLSNVKFVGCMPVNFSRHNIEEIQRSPENAYYLSEKTDGVRYFLVFTGTTAVLLDRKMRGKQPKLRPGNDPAQDPLAPILSLIKPGTVLDGEVVMHRKPRRPIFIVFDVLTLSTSTPVLHLPFEQRLHHLKRAAFRAENANRDMFDESAVADPKISLPLIRKNFVKRYALNDLLSRVTEEYGMRTYRSGHVHNHLTDGIIFQPNLPYVCGTDVNLLKWKYLDTVTIDVEILPYRDGDDDDTLRVGVMGEEGTTIDMTRFVKLPGSERYRLEADRAETNSKIAEVGFDPTTGEWYYLTMRPDKEAPNHISTVLGTILELAESLTTEELLYRMSIPFGMRDTFSRDVCGMLRQLLEHQRTKNQKHSQGQNHR